MGPAARFACVLLLPLLALAPPARAGDREAEKKAAAAEKGFLEAYVAAASDEKARAKAVETLASAPDAVKVGILLEKVIPKDDSPAVQTAAVAVLRKAGSDEGIRALAAAAQGKGPWVSRGAAIEALGAFPAPAASATLRGLLKSTEPRAVASALFALAEGHPQDALEDVKKVVDHGAWQVRLGTLDYLGRLRDASTVALLADRLEEETGRLKMEVVEALKSITGKDYGKDAAKWRAFAAGGAKAADEAGAKPGDPAAGGGGGGGRVAVATGAQAVEPTYYGQKVWSDRVVFVVDVSLSMNLEMVVDRDTIVRETGAVVSGGHGEPGEKPDAKREDEVSPIEWWKIKTRLDFAKSQLKYVVSTLKRDQHFDIVWFGEEVGAWQGRMVPAQPGIKFKAANWIEGLECNGPRDGGTNSWGGLMKALNLVGKGTDEENYGRGADTLYFMSDGQPTCGDIKDEAQIVAAIERIHKVRRVKIHVAQIGTSPLPFMKRLASATGGDFKFFNAKGPAK